MNAPNVCNGFPFLLMHKGGLCALLRYSCDSISQISAGYGKESHGSQLVNWQSVASVKAASSVDTGDDPLGLRLLEHFTGNCYLATCD